MRRILLLLPLLALAGCQKEEAPQRAVKLMVSYSGFLPGCVLVVAEDVNTGEELSTTMDSMDGGEDRALVVAVLPPEGWGSSLRVEASAFEQRCEGDPVVSDEATLTLTPGAPTPVTLTLTATDADGDGYVSIATGGTDCQDNRDTVHPGVLEVRCNGVDDNCDDQPHEDERQLDQACVTAEQCGGRYACDAAGNVTCQATQLPASWTLDEDGDGYGSGTAVPSCQSPSPRHVAMSGDCDEGNPFIYPNASELCDSDDNDCDSQADESQACSSGAPTWVSRSVGTGTWYAASAWTEGGVWVVGGNRRALLTPDRSTFTMMTSGCGDTGSNWYSVWADPESGRAYLGSSGGWLGYQDTGSTACTTEYDANLLIYGLVGFRIGSNLQLAGVSKGVSPNPGAAFLWDGGGAVTFDGGNQLEPVTSIHGRSLDSLFAVGGLGYPDYTVSSPRLYRFDLASLRWVSANVESISGVRRLWDVWVVDPKLAYAVGEGGSVLRWDGGAWSKMDFPSSTETLVSVIAFGQSSVYAAAATGRVYRYDGEQWRKILDDTRLRLTSITGTSPGDLWVVGESGLILHWPQ